MASSTTTTQSSLTPEYTNIGSIDEEGLINSLDRDGLTLDRANLEIIGNVPDAYNNIDSVQKDLEIRIHPNAITFKDGGKGFTRESAEIGFSLYKSAHAKDKSVGVSNYGLKSATKQLSANGKTIINTHAEGNPYLQIEIDWARIIKEKKYTSNIRIREMTESEKHNFISEMNGNNTGTIIMFPYTESVHEAIKSQFKKDERLLKLPVDRVDYAFGKINNFKICYRDMIDSEYIELQMYNPYALDRSSFLFGGNGKSQKTIELYMKTSCDDDYIFAQRVDDNENTSQYEYFKPSTKTTSKSTAKKLTTGLIPKGYTLVEEFAQQLTCIKPEKDYYDESDPKQPTDTRLRSVSNYEKDFYGNTTHGLDYRNNTMPLVRNGARIGIIPIGPKAQSCGGGTQEDKFTKLQVQNELCYAPYSSQVNKSDILLGVQKNKHSLHPDEKRLKGLIRLCEHNRNAFAKHLWDSMAPPPPKLPTPVPPPSRSPSPVPPKEPSPVPVPLPSPSPVPVPPKEPSPSPVPSRSPSPVPVPLKEPSPSPMPLPSPSPVPVPPKEPSPVPVPPKEPSPVPVPPKEPSPSPVPSRSPSPVPVPLKEPSPSPVPLPSPSPVPVPLKEPSPSPVPLPSPSPVPVSPNKDIAITPPPREPTQKTQKEGLMFIKRLVDKINRKEIDIDALIKKTNDTETCNGLIEQAIITFQDILDLNI